MLVSSFTSESLKMFVIRKEPRQKFWLFVQRKNYKNCVFVEKMMGLIVFMLSLQNVWYQMHIGKGHVPQTCHRNI